MSDATYRLEVFRANGIGGTWEEFGYSGLSPADTNFYSGYLNRSTNHLVRAVRESDGEVFCGRVPE